MSRELNFDNPTKWGIREGMKADSERNVVYQRPWGTWEIIDSGKGYMVTRIVVRSGHRLSLHRHQFRVEHLTVVQGMATVTLGDPSSNRYTIKRVLKNGHVVFGRNEIHRIANNISPDDLVCIEAQYADPNDTRLDDDIERLHDDYGLVRT